MNSFSTKAITAALATAIGMTAIAPAMAQSAPPAPDAAVAAPDAAPEAMPDAPVPPGPRHGPHGPRRPGGPDMLFDFARGGEEMEVALVRLSYRLDLTTEQEGLLEALKTAARSAADDFGTATEGLRPTPPAEGETPVMPSITERLANRIAMEKAQLAALEAVQPAVTAFFDSLTDEQKAQLTPQPGEGGWGPRGQHNQDGKPGPRGMGGNHG
jgi:hypothetical protein